VTALAVAGAVVALLMLLGMVGLHVRVERLERFLQLQARFNEAQKGLQELLAELQRLVDVLPNGPSYHPTVRAYLAGGVPEVMLHLRRLVVTPG